MLKIQFLLLLALDIFSFVPNIGAIAPVIVDLIPNTNENRPGAQLSPGTRYITIHNTGNSSPGGTAKNYANFLKSPGIRARSWHFTVDDHSIYQHLPTSEVGWHTETAAGNMKSIGVKICENSNGDFESAVRNAQALVAMLMRDENIPISRVVAHQQWSGKNCPQLLLDAGRWASFIEGIPGYGNGYGNRRTNLDSNSPCFGTVRDARLRIYERPDLRSTILGHFVHGALIELLDRTTGSPVNQNTNWFRVSNGYIPAYFVRIAQQGSGQSWCVN